MEMAGLKDGNRARSDFFLDAGGVIARAWSYVHNRPSTNVTRPLSTDSGKMLSSGKNDAGRR